MSDQDERGADSGDGSAREPTLRCSRCEREVPVSTAIEAPVGYQCRECAKGAVPARRLTDAASRAPVTRAAVAVIAGLFVVSQVAPEAISSFGLRPVLVGPDGPAWLDAAVGWYQASALALAIGEPWRLVTSAFLHGGIIHVGFNGLLLWQLGHLLEPLLGRGRFLALCAASMMGGALGVVGLAWVGAATGGNDTWFGTILGGDPFQTTIGASGVVFGLMGAAMVGMRERGVNPWRTSIGTLVLLNLALTFFVPSISVGGHLGGLLGGWLAARWLFVPREQAGRAIRIVTLLTVAMVVAAIALAWAILPTLGV